MANDHSTTRLIQPSRGGQITIPADLSRQLGIEEGTMLRVRLVDGELRISPVQPVEAQRGSPWLNDLYALYAPVRQEILDRKIPEAELAADIDAAITAVRTKRATNPR